MNSAEIAALATPEYWDTRYKSSDGENPTHEWFRSFEALAQFFQKHVFEGKHANTNPRILHLGPGDSTIPSNLADRDYKNQLCVDFLTVVVEMMSQKHGTDSGIEWKWADVRDMPNVASSSIDVAFDTGTLDAMIHGSPWDPLDDVKENTLKYLREAHRVLKDDGVFLYVTFRQPHFMKLLLNREGLWQMEMETLSDSTSAFDYQAFILTKA